MADIEQDLAGLRAFFDQGLAKLNESGHLNEWAGFLLGGCVRLPQLLAVRDQIAGGSLAATEEPEMDAILVFAIDALREGCDGTAKRLRDRRTEAKRREQQ